MDNMKKVLLVINSLTSSDIDHINRAKALASENGFGIEVNLLYIKPYFPTCYFNIPSMLSLAEEFDHEAKTILQTVSKELDVNTDHQWITTGKIKTETFKLASSLGADYILSNSKICKELHHSFQRRKHVSAPEVKNIEALHLY